MNKVLLVRDCSFLLLFQQQGLHARLEGEEAKNLKAQEVRSEHRREEASKETRGAKAGFNPNACLYTGGTKQRRKVAKTQDGRGAKKQRTKWRKKKEANARSAKVHMREA